LQQYGEPGAHYRQAQKDKYGAGVQLNVQGSGFNPQYPKKKKKPKTPYVWHLKKSNS
jgi:hypothetical protein